MTSTASVVDEEGRRYDLETLEEGYGEETIPKNQSARGVSEVFFLSFIRSLRFKFVVETLRMFERLV